MSLFNPMLLHMHWIARRRLTPGLGRYSVHFLIRVWWDRRRMSAGLLPHPSLAGPAADVARCPLAPGPFQSIAGALFSSFRHHHMHMYAYINRWWAHRTSRGHPSMYVYKCLLCHDPPDSRPPDPQNPLFRVLCRQGVIYYYFYILYSFSLFVQLLFVFLLLIIILIIFNY